MDYDCDIYFYNKRKRKLLDVALGRDTSLSGALFKFLKLGDNEACRESPLERQLDYLFCI